MKVIVIGGGVVGLWTALQAARAKLSVILIEKQAHVGSISSLRNSAVLHTGIYYKNGSSKAIHCVRGHALTLDFLRDHQVPYRLCGKFIIDKDQEKLATLRMNAIDNQVKNTEIIKLSHDEYPYLRADYALHSKNTGVVCLKTYMATLQKLAEKAGVKILTQHTCIGGTNGSVQIRNQFGTIKDFKTDYIVNAGGLFADEIASYFGLNDFQIKPNKGIYFLLKRPLPIEKLIYPFPCTDSTHLGLHYTIDVNGTAFAGPNAQWIENKEDYSLETDKDKFFKAFSELTSFYQIDDLTSINRVGLRARLYANNLPVNDFIIQESPPKVIHLLGIESPGLTSAPSLADEVVQRILA